MENELTEEQIEIILKVLKNNKIISELEYEIINDVDQYNGLKEAIYITLEMIQSYIQLLWVESQLLDIQ